MKKLPIGIQSIRNILTGEYVYVDKTPLALELIDKSKHYFLSRPRRFGKSLFLSTLAEIFKGNKELFKGCAIYDSAYDWQPHPVLHFDFSEIANATPEKLEEHLRAMLTRIGAPTGPSLEFQLSVLIEALAKQAQVVILVDEYDAPIIDHLQEPAIAEANRELLRSFYKVLKASEAHIRFTFVTGISKFSQVSLFSGPNHLNDLTMHPQYATMLGYTEQEVVQYFGEHIQAIAQERSKQGKPTTDTEILAEIKQWYNGYRFSRADTYVYNPFSTLNFLDEKTPRSYWYATGTPSFLLHEISNRPEMALSLKQIEATASQLSSISRVDRMPLAALMFQTGYLTIQDYRDDPEEGELAYTLDFPNKEVRQAFVNSLLDELAEVDPLSVSRVAKQLRTDLGAYKLGAFVNALNVHFAKMPYYIFKDAKEGFYQALFFTLLEKSGIRTQTEVATNKGRIDVMCALEETIYIFELKVNHPASIGLNQAQIKAYSQRYTQQGKAILVMGVSFSTETRDIHDWIGELQDAEGKVLQTFGPEVDLAGNPQV